MMLKGEPNDAGADRRQFKSLVGIVGKLVVKIIADLRPQHHPPIPRPPVYQLVWQVQP